jgi:hypothetical protein
MTTTESALKELYQKQPEGLFPSEADYLNKFELITTEMFERQPKNINLPRETVKTIIISFQADFGLSLVDIERRLNAMPGTFESRNPTP